MIGAAITLVLLFLWIPRFGYLGAAWATLICYAAMAVVSYLWGQKHFPVPYNVGRVLGYMAAGVFLWWGCEQVPLESEDLIARALLDWGQAALAGPYARPQDRRARLSAGLRNRHGAARRGEGAGVVAGQAAGGG